MSVHSSLCALAWPVIFVASVHAGAAAQPSAQPDAELVRIASLADAGRLGDARRALAGWKTANPLSRSGVPASARAHALMLQARLATTWAAAEESYTAVALGYPVSSHAPEALLRLAQGLTIRAAAGNAANTADARRAAAYLERLIVDYPVTPLLAEAFLWLARAYTITGQTPLGCTRLARAQQLEADSVTHQLVRAHMARNCNRD